MSWSHRQHVIRCLSLSLFMVAGFCPSGSVALAADVDFYRDVYPILKSNCIACHNKTTTKAALNMETPEAMRKGGDSGEGLVPGKATESLIFQAAAHIGELEMPPRGNKSGASKLTPSELALLKSWIDQGAKSSAKQAREVVWQPLPPGVHPIYSVAITHDGRFAVCGRANQIFVYDLATRQFVSRLADDSLNQTAPVPATGTAHRAFVQSLAFSPDGTRLASGSFREVKIWRRVDEPAVRHKGDPKLAAVISVLSVDGKTLVSTDKQGTLHILDAESGKILKTVSTGQTSGIKFISLSPDTAKAAVYGSDGVLSVWSLEEGRRFAGKPALSGVRCLAWTRDGKAIATGGEDKVIRIWGLPSGEKTDLVNAKELKGAAGVITTIEVGREVLAASSLDGKVHLWSLAEGKPLASTAVAGVEALALSGDDRLLALGRADGVVQVWDVATRKPIVDLSGDLETNAKLADLSLVIEKQRVETIFQKKEAARIEALNKGLADLLTKTNDTIATVRKDLAEKKNALKQATEAHKAAQQAVNMVMAQVAKAPGGKPDAALEKALKDAQAKQMAAENAETAARDAFKAREIHLKDAEGEAQNYTASQARNKLSIEAANAASVKSKAAQDKAAADADAIRKAVAARKLKPLALCFSSDSKTVAGAWGDGAVRVWAVPSGIPVQFLPGNGNLAAASLVGSPAGILTAAAADGSIARVNTTPHWILERTIGGQSADTPFVDRVNAIRFSPDGKTLAAGSGEPSRSGDLSLWDVASGKLIHEWKERHSDAILSLDFSPDGKRLASGGADKIARVTEIATGKIVNVFEGHTHHVLGLSFRTDGRVLATAGGDNSVVIWDMLSGERQKKIEGWSKEVTSLHFVGATSQIVTSAGDGRVRIVHDTGAEIRVMPKLTDFMQSAVASADAHVIIAGGEESLLHVWNGQTGQELAVFGADSNANRP